MTLTLVELLRADPMPQVPEHLRGGLKRYVLYGLAPGHFLTAVLEHNLFEAFKRGDKASLAGLPELVHYIHNVLPSGCNGNPERVTQWCERGGLIGIEKEVAL